MLTLTVIFVRTICDYWYLGYENRHYVSPWEVKKEHREQP